MKKYMSKKSGISLLIVTTAVVIMLILISTATVIGSNAITSANYDEYISSIRRVSDEVNEYYLENKTLPATSDIVNYSSVSDDFKTELAKNNDASNKLFVVDVSLLNDKTIKKGMGNIEDKDVFLVAEETHNVYYMKGFKYKSKIYYGV